MKEKKEALERVLPKPENNVETKLGRSVRYLTGHKFKLLRPLGWTWGFVIVVTFKPAKGGWNWLKRRLTGDEGL